MKSTLLLIILIVLWPNVACRNASGTDGGTESITKHRHNSSDIEFSIKEKAVRNGPLPRAGELKVVRSIQSELGGNGPLVYPASIAICDRGRVYLTDNNAHLIRYTTFDSEAIVTMPSVEGSGRLLWPNLIEHVGRSLFITDNEGIKVFSEDGSFEQLLRTYYQINHFAVRPDGKIYVNPSFRTRKLDNPLIVELDRGGKKIRGFGTRLNGPDTIGLSDEVYVRTTDDYIVAVFKHSPIVRVYNDQGMIVREFKVDHPAFEALGVLMNDKSFVMPEPSKQRLPRYISGARIVGDRLLVLLDLPYPEIAEFDLYGRETNRYLAAQLSPVKVCKDFDARPAGGGYRFWILFGDGENLASLAELATSEAL